MISLNGVFEGGGVKGIGLVGALKRLEEKGVQFEGVGGTSAGAMVAALYAAGYTADELRDIFVKTDFRSLLDPSWPKWWDLYRHKGIHKGKKLYEWVYWLLQRKGVTTFRDLRVDLRIVASDLTNRDVLTFSADTHPTMKVAEAVRMSIGIPLFFEAYKFGEKLVVDGGILTNYPLWIFSHSSKPVIGLKLVSEQEETELPTAPASFAGYITAVLATMMEAHDKENERRSGWARTIHIPTGRVATTNFKLSDSDKHNLYNSGYVAATQFLEGRGQDILRGA